MITTHHWGPYPPALARAEHLARSAKKAPGAIVLELGPGAIPFSEATHFAGRAPLPRTLGRSPLEMEDGGHASVLDLSRDMLPFEDGEVDYLYCRHVLEDLADPIHLLEEIRRVAKAGYIETPSPMAELTRGVDGGSPPWRGYHHHRSICWVEPRRYAGCAEVGDTLHLVAKYPMVEHLDIGNGCPDELNPGPLHWNTYYFFDAGEAGRVGYDWRLHEHDVDFKVWDGSYRMLLRRAMEQSLERNDALEQSWRK